MPPPRCLPRWRRPIRTTSGCTCGWRMRVKRPVTVRARSERSSAPRNSCRTFRASRTRIARSRRLRSTTRTTLAPSRPSTRSSRLTGMTSMRRASARNCSSRWVTAPAGRCVSAGRGCRPVRFARPDHRWPRSPAAEGRAGRDCAFRAALGAQPPDKAVAHFDLAQAYLLGGQSADAKRETLEALEIAPSFEPAQDLLLKIVAGG